MPAPGEQQRQIAFGFAMYRWRHLVENFFCDLKQFRRIATRYDKLGATFFAFIKLAAVRIWLRSHPSLIAVLAKVLA